MSYGLSWFGFGPFGISEEPAEAVHVVLVGAREIDGVSRRYTQDADGNPLPMDGTAQRVLILLSYADTSSDIITPQALATQKAKLRAALVPLTSGREPAIRNLTIDVTDDGKARTLKLVTYTNALTNTKTSLRVR